MRQPGALYWQGLSQVPSALQWKQIFAFLAKS